MVKASDLCTQCRIPLDEGWGYIWGSYGQIWTQKAQTNAVARRGTNWKQTQKYGSKWIGKHVLDCSGLLYWAFKQLGGTMYHGANTMFNSWTMEKGKITKDTALLPGMAVFLYDGKKRHHVGVYVGNGTVIEAKGTRWGVVTSNVYTWDEWGTLKGCEYDLEADTAEATSSVSATATLRKGDSGLQVKDLQEKLIAMGYDCGSTGADGKFGANTLAAVKKFQQEKGLNADGVVGSATWGKLNQGTETPSVKTDDTTAVEKTNTMTDNEKLEILWDDYQTRKGMIV